MVTKFAELTKAEKRVAVAKDVLKQLKYIMATPGTYFQMSKHAKMELSFNKQSESIKRSCHVCAIGGLFIGLIDKKNVCLNSTDCYRNHLNVGFLSDSLRKELESLFTVNQLYLIEGCFEGWDDIGNNYYVKYRNHEERMKAIMKNIVRNNGTFKPKQDLKESK